MKVLSITSLFPDTTRPTFAPFNLKQMISLAGKADVRLISPVPWTHRLKMMLRGRAIGPPRECRGTMEVFYPTYFFVPKMLRSTYGWSYYASIRTVFNEQVDEFHPDVVYATWAYPDCYGAYVAAKKRGLPIVLRMHGSDINEYMRFPSRRRRILEAADGSGAVIVVSKALKRILVDAGVDPGKVHLVYNGIDGTVFFPRDREESRRALGLGTQTAIILFAGNLKHVKGVDVLLEAFGGLDVTRPAELHILGDGPLKGRLISDIKKLGLERRVFLHGSVPHAEIPVWLGASDLLCLPSRSEGTPNIVLEALACSRPVVASNVGGIGEIISESDGIISKKSGSSFSRLINSSV